MKVPDGVPNKSAQVCRLKNPCRDQNKLLVNGFLSCFMNCFSKAIIFDYSLFIKNWDGLTTIVVVYVDDIIVI